MRLPKNAIAIITATDGTVIRGRVIRSWRWHVVRLTTAEILTPQGAIPAGGDILMPWRSILLAQTVNEAPDE